ncbi:hypothetical protein CAP36_08935 [Chitinophagaceae bacterium IBVUCB2]|nr:hypothetical protein CAP36_08935 [Chitinophagaceae bacterium IBVUCB2]
MSRKSFKLTCIFLFLPLFFFGQSLTGLWVGSVSNDSTTVRKDQSFEIALTEYKGKVYGYSRSEFIVDDVLYYIVKRVSGTIEGDVCEVTDDEIISYNFPKLLDKKVKVTSTFRRNKSDSVWYLAGKWKTNVTKKYYSVSGRVDLEEEKDLTASKIFPHLEELKLADAVVFYKERKEGQPIVKIAKPEKVSTGISSAITPLTTNSEAMAITDKPIVSKNNTSAIPNPINNITAAATETNKEQTSSSLVKNTSTIEEPQVNTELASVKRADNTQKTATKNISSSKVDAVPSSNTVLATNKPVAEEKNNSLPDVVVVPVLEKKDETTSTAIKSNSVKQETVLNPTTAVVEKKEIVPQKQDAIIKTESTANTTVATKNNPAPSSLTTEKKETAAVVKQDVATNKKPVAKNESATNTTAAIKNNTISNPTTPKTTTVANTGKKENAVVANQEVAANTKPATKKEPAANPAVENKIASADAPITPLKPEIKTPSIDITLKAAIIAGRKSEFSQQVNFKSDSLQVALYDNGEIDGDTVSVFMNGEVIMAKQGLKSSAIRKTIYLTPGQEEFTLVLFAENLGKYPPNTGLLVVRDGDDVYNLRFSSDFQKNSGILFRRKK